MTPTVSTVGMGTRLHARPGVPTTWGTHAQEQVFNRQPPQRTGSAALARLSALTLHCGPFQAAHVRSLDVGSRSSGHNRPGQLTRPEAGTRLCNITY